MNRIYKSIWNIKTGTFIAVAENARSAGKKSSLCKPMSTRRLGFALKTLAASIFMISGSSMLYAQPVGGVVSAGSAQIGSTLANTTINQSSQNVAINWQSFNINRGESGNFVQPNREYMYFVSIIQSSSFFNSFFILTIIFHFFTFYNLHSIFEIQFNRFRTFNQAIAVHKNSVEFVIL